jgi:MoaA/NifB/PqqE/SkfB family radical SAM enzyme
VSQIREIKIELTQQCPLACVHCSSNSSPKALIHLSSEVVRRVIQEARFLGVKEISFSGGEPLIYPWLQDVLLECKSASIATQIYTSGVTSDRFSPLSEEEAAVLGELSVARLIFSVYSTDARIHNTVTGFPSLDATIQAIKNARTSGLKCQIHLVAFRRNFRELTSVAALAEELGVSRISILRLVPHGRARTIFVEENLTSEEYQQLAGAVNRIRSTSGVEIRLGSPLNMLGLDYAPCAAAGGVLTIDFRGRVLPCDAFKDYDYPGDACLSVIHMSLSEILARSRFLAHVSAAVPRAGDHSGCLAQAVFRAGTFSSGADPDWQRLGSATELVQIQPLS